MKQWNLILILSLAAVVAVGCNGDDVAARDDAAPAASNEERVLVEGLTVKDVVEGDGVEAQKGDVVTVHYTGWVYNDGVKAAEPFDSSIPRGEPTSFPVGVGRLIRGWDEGIPGMKVGGKRELIISPEMGYGARGAGDAIPPDATLFFEVELVDVPRVQMEDTVVGDGPVAEEGDNVKVHYTGWLYEDGAKKGEPFDSSHNRNQPFGFQLGAGMVIPGWDQGVQGMHVGGQRTLIIPPSLGYGARGAGAAIPPNSTLIFDVELLEVEGK